MTNTRQALAALVAYVERNECRHEETHRGGAIWTICNDCGRKWADDRGGFVPYEQPKLIADAYAALDALSAQPVAELARWEWLASHCRALGMTKKSDSGLIEHDIALFVADLKDAAQPVAGTVAHPVAWLCSISHPDWLEVCERDAPGAFPVYATPQPQAAPAPEPTKSQVKRKATAMGWTPPQPEPSDEAECERGDMAMREWHRECDDADTILRALGLDPVNCRTDGGSLKTVMILDALQARDRMLQRDASHKPQQAAPLTDGELEAIMNKLNVSLTGFRGWGWKDLARAIERAHGIAPKAAQEDN